MSTYRISHGNVTVNLDSSVLTSKLQKAQKVLNAQVIIDCTPYVPFKQGILSNSVHPSNDYKQIIWNGPYAQFQYYGKVMVGIHSRSTWAYKGEKKEVVPGWNIKYSKEGHPKASAFWFEKAKEQHLKNWIAKTKKAVK
jgi:hypothetical protein